MIWGWGLPYLHRGCQQNRAPPRFVPYLGGFLLSRGIFLPLLCRQKGITSRRGAASPGNTPRTPAGIPHPQARPLAVQLVDEHITKLLQGARLKLAPRIWRPKNKIPLNYGASTALFRRHHAVRACRGAPLTNPFIFWFHQLDSSPAPRRMSNSSAELRCLPAPRLLGEAISTNMEIRPGRGGQETFTEENLLC